MKNISAKEVTIWNILLVACADYLVSRWWNYPRAKGRSVIEARWRSHFGLWIPTDSMDTFVCDDRLEELKKIYPQIDHCNFEFYFLAGVSTPLSPCVCYYDTRMVHARGAEAKLLSVILELKFSSLFAAAWWQ